MYNLEVFNKYNISLSLKDLFLGISYDYFSYSILNDYFNMLYNTLSYDKKYDVLLNNFENKQEALDCLKDLTDIRNINDNDVSFFKRKLRYVLLCDANNKIKDEEELLFKISEIYEYFDCPKEMNDFIYYMHVTDNMYNPSTHSKSENYKRLMDLFYTFLETEKQLFMEEKNKDII